MPIRVTDPADPRLDRFRWRDRQLASRTDRLEAVGAGLFVAEGDLVVERAIDSGCVPIALLCDDQMGAEYASRVHDAEIYVADETLRREVTGLGVPLRATGLFRRPALVSPDGLVARSRWIVAVEQVDNPTNLGAIIRSAAGLGFDALVLDHSSTDPLARRALRVSMGTALALPFARLEPGDSLGALLDRHPNTAYALTPSATAVDLRSITSANDVRTVVLLGSERDGLSLPVMARAVNTRIPMHASVDSLNVGAAAAIALHHLGPNAR